MGMLPANRIYNCSKAKFSLPLHRKKFRHNLPLGIGTFFKFFAHKLEIWYSQENALIPIDNAKSNPPARSNHE